MKEEIEKLRKEVNDRIDKFEKQLMKIDFSEFICRHDHFLAIKGEKLLKSHDDGDITWTNWCRDRYKAPISYEECTLADMNNGDVFISVADTNKKMCLENFNIFIGKDACNEFIVQYLQGRGSLERINFTNYYGEDIKVYRFKRE